MNFSLTWKCEGDGFFGGNSASRFKRCRRIRAKKVAKHYRRTVTGVTSESEGKEREKDTVSRVSYCKKRLLRAHGQRYGKTGSTSSKGEKSRRVKQPLTQHVVHKRQKRSKTTTQKQSQVYPLPLSRMFLSNFPLPTGSGRCCVHFLRYPRWR